MKSSYAFMTYEAPESATEAITKMNGAKFINGEEIVVEQSGTK
jgi:RNA recognition motif-containing protein